MLSGVPERHWRHDSLQTTWRGVQLGPYHHLEITLLGEDFTPYQLPPTRDADENYLALSSNKLWDVDG